MNQSEYPARTQRGAALVVVLILLLLMTLLGLASLRGTLLEERMGANMLDRSLGFQAAEAALRVAEARADALPVFASGPPASPAFPAVGCVNELCATPLPNALDRWNDPAFTGWFVNPTITLGGGAVVLPQYFIEDMQLAENWLGCSGIRPMDDQCISRRYRIVARSSANDRAQVTLVSSFASVP